MFEVAFLVRGGPGPMPRFGIGTGPAWPWRDGGGRPFGLTFAERAPCARPPCACWGLARPRAPGGRPPAFSQHGAFTPLCSSIGRPSWGGRSRSRGRRTRKRNALRRSAGRVSRVWERVGVTPSFRQWWYSSPEEDYTDHWANEVADFAINIYIYMYIYIYPGSGSRAPGSLYISAHLFCFSRSYIFVFP